MKKHFSRTGADRMRFATRKERESVDKYIRSISKDCGISFYDLLEQGTEESKMWSYSVGVSWLRLDLAADPYSDRNCSRRIWINSSHVTSIGEDDAGHALISLVGQNTPLVAEASQEDVVKGLGLGKE